MEYVLKRHVWYKDGNVKSFFFRNHDNYFIIKDDMKKSLQKIGWAVKDACIVDIEYVGDPYEHIDYMDLFDTGRGRPFPINIGLIKRKTWSFEGETRARVYIESIRSIRTRLEYAERHYPFLVIYTVS